MAGEMLQVVSGPATGRSIEVTADFVVGRIEAGMGNLMGDDQISRRHARFRRLDDGRLIVEDLGSTNGTFVNGQRIAGPHVLALGDQVRLGNTVLRLEPSPSTAAAAAGAGGGCGAAAPIPPQVEAQA